MKNLERYIETHVKLAARIKGQQSEVVSLFNSLFKCKYDVMRHLLGERTSAIIAFYNAQQHTISTLEGFDVEDFFSKHGKVIKACDRAVLTSKECRYRGRECIGSDNALYITHLRNEEVLFNESYIEDMFKQLEIAKYLIKEGLGE